MERLGDALNRLKIADVISRADTAISSNTDERVEADEPTCPRCKDRGFLRLDVPVEDPNFGKLAPCDCRRDSGRTERIRWLERRSNLGPLADRTFDSLVRSGRSPDHAQQERFGRALAVTEAFAQEPNGWLVLLGPSGCGKTHLAAAVCQARIARAEAAFFAVVPDLLDHLRATYRPDSEVPFDELFETVRNCPLLVLDDLGVQSSTPWAQEKLFQLINHRYNFRLPTVFTSNLRLDDMEERVRTRLQDTDLSRIVVAEDWGQPELGQLSWMGLERLREMTFESFKPSGALGRDEDAISNLRNALRQCRQFANAPSDWLVIEGGTGRGKTHLAAAIANARVAMGEPAYFVTAPDLLDHLRATYSPDSGVAYDKVFESVRGCPLLILDDLGAHSSTPWAEEKLFQILNHRYNGKLPTVITVTLPVDNNDPPLNLEPRLISRIQDPSLCTAVPIKAPPYRLAEEPRARGRPRPRRP